MRLEERKGKDFWRNPSHGPESSVPCRLEGTPFTENLTIFRARQGFLQNPYMAPDFSNRAAISKDTKKKISRDFRPFVG